MISWKPSLQSAANFPLKFWKGADHFARLSFNLRMWLDERVDQRLRFLFAEHGCQTAECAKLFGPKNGVLLIAVRTRPWSRPRWMSRLDTVTERIRTPPN